ncbi:multi-sensor signal transduction histidine kinase [Neobacillus bataviensis LMG 21833]|uniref:histidine kinase n=1 Tax=Neobacillus bataviensis LMG 21833 TaxID=1117379 RepID=K6DQJ6_9BACI|nr:response regulator [Neobacillus bataviensis]EKN70468.1 multi-sensor signal transduction histidine kinase [Neobacillus bataviensis LMG 21833]
MEQKDSTVNLNSTTAQKVNILMVDNHPENLLALEAVLTSPNYHLVSATSGYAALKCLLKQECAVILLDVQMPGLNGFETAKLIKEREKTKHIPIIFITAISQDMEHVQHGYSVGAIDYIFKPFHPETLKQKIEKFVEIYQIHKESELQRSAELNVVNKRLDQTTLDLQRSEALAKVISDTLLDTIVTFDGEGGILSVNPAVKTMFGYHEEEIVGESVSNLFVKVMGDNGNCSPDLFFSLFKPFIGSVMESVALRKDDSHFPADIQIGEAAVGGQQIFVCTIRDVTERKQMEEVKRQQFNQMEKMVKDRTLELVLANEQLQKEIEERNKMTEHLSRLDRLNLIGEMAAGIAHEIRNPMTTVSGFLQVARSDSEGLPQEIVNLMLDELSRANSIITEFLNLAKNKVSYKKIQNLNTIIDALFPLIQAEALRARKQAILNLHKCPDISIDEKEIRQLILNIVLNGLDAMSSGGQLTIKTYVEEQEVILEIKDQGTGISSEVLEKIGTPFFTTKENGTGLGLAICYSVADRHQADIDIETGEEGTAFFIRFKKI